MRCYISKENQLVLGTHLVIIITAFLLLCTDVNAEIIGATSLCLENQIQFGSRCIPCPVDHVSQNNRCVKYSSAGHTNKIKQQEDYINPMVEYPTPQSQNNFQIPNCLKVSPPPPKLSWSIMGLNSKPICLQCKKNYQIIASGICVQASCKIYSQVLNKCLDNTLNADIIRLYSQGKAADYRRGVTQTPKYVIGQRNIPDKLLYQPISIPLHEQQIHLGDSYSYFIDQYIQPVTTAQVQPKNQTINCIKLINNRCMECPQGYLINLLTNLCVFVDPPVFIVAQKLINQQQKGGLFQVGSQKQDIRGSNVEASNISMSANKNNVSQKQENKSALNISSSVQMPKLSMPSLALDEQLFTSSIQLQDQNQSQSSEQDSMHDIYLDNSQQGIQNNQYQLQKGIQHS